MLSCIVSVRLISCAATEHHFVGKINKKGSCNFLHIYWGVGGGGESRNPSHNPVIYQSWPFATKHSSLIRQYLPERENCTDSCLYSSSRCGMNSKHIWNLIEHLYEYPDSHSSWTPPWCARVLCQHPPSPGAPDFQTCKSMVLLGVSHQEGNVCVTCLLLQFLPILQFCTAIDSLCAGCLTLIYNIFTTSNWLQVHHPLPSTLNRLLLTFTYFVILFIAICLLISFSLSLFCLFCSPFTPASESLFVHASPFPSVTSLLCIMNLVFCHGLGETCACQSLLSHWHLSAPQPFCPLFWVSAHPLLLIAHALSSPQEETQMGWHWAQPMGMQGLEPTPECHAVLSPSSGAAQLCNPWCTRWTRWENKQELKGGLPTVQGII